MSSSAPAAARWPRMRCARCAAPASRRRSIWSRPARCCAPRRPKRLARALARRSATLPRTGPLLVVANEFFDALPVRQMSPASGWRERLVGHDGRRSCRDRASRAETRRVVPTPAGDLEIVPARRVMRARHRARRAARR